MLPLRRSCLQTVKAAEFLPNRASSRRAMRRVSAHRRQWVGPILCRVPDSPDVEAAFQARVITTALPVPKKHDHNYQHHALNKMRRLYLSSRCSVFHSCYRIPLGQNLRVGREGPRLDVTQCSNLYMTFSSLLCNMTLDCYKAIAIQQFLGNGWGFLQQATDAIRSIDTELA